MSDSMTRKKIRVLMIDDERFNHVIVGKILMRESIDFFSTCDPLEGLQMISQDSYDVLLLDIVMPQMNGTELLKHIRVKEPTLPVIFLSSLVDDLDNTLLDLISSDVCAFYVNKNKMGSSLLARVRMAVKYNEQESQNLRVAKEIREEAELAGHIQRLILPEYIEYTYHAEISAYFKPVGFVSGDFYSHLTLPDGRMIFFIGDVSGHGMQAALYMTAVLSLFNSRFFMENGTHPHQILQSMNHYFSEINSTGSYYTCIVGVFDFNNNTFTFQNAGHTSPVWAKNCGLPQCEITSLSLEKGGIPIGWDSSYVYLEANTECIHFNDNDDFLFYTDGLLGATENCSDFGFDEFHALSTAYLTQSERIMFPFRFISAIQKMGYPINQDDVTLVRVAKSDSAPLVLHRAVGASLDAVSSLCNEVCVWVEEKTSDFMLSAKVQLLLLEFLQNEVIYSDKNLTNKHQSYVIVTLAPNLTEATVQVLDQSLWANFEACYNRVRAEIVTGDMGAAMLSHGRGIRMILELSSTMRRSTDSGVNLTEFVIQNTPPSP